MGFSSSLSEYVSATLDALGGVEIPTPVLVLNRLAGGVASNTELMRISDPDPKKELQLLVMLI